ncbi:hypothetical protein U0X36_25865 [Bacillus thuringiensis]|uniref:Uncharacterized protein n=1 Tax=Bacillus cereus (strain VD146) TaxID=1053236 RepID=R8MDP6_BACCX|nr:MULTISPECIES: hypothetical protein [Bacillus cereus group]EOP32266.1 hypothetical protein IK1_05802 [Bacillus cereus VD146]MDZ3956241.1 hypothetical protein [Bacillus thuringiensis]RGP43348.1 hypothetical protein BTW32_29965 [Bacillus thuringiensis]
MAKVDPMKKMNDIDEQIRKLKEKQKRLMSQAQREAGKYLMEQWGVSDLEQAKQLIDQFSEQAILINSNQKDSESNDEENKHHENTSTGNTPSDETLQNV